MTSNLLSIKRKVTCRFQLKCYCPIIAHQLNIICIITPLKGCKEKMAVLVQAVE
ncbi:MAG: hypothetical protein LWX08_02415 [Deltaproteobacteria bacterium]|nr:hypothetical protein [Deltaproteobacteria bacterium]